MSQYTSVVSVGGVDEKTWQLRPSQVLCADVGAEMSQRILWATQQLSFGQTRTITVPLMGALGQDVDLAALTCRR